MQYDEIFINFRMESIVSSLTCVYFLIITCLTYICYGLFRKGSFGRNLPPGPRPWPILGNGIFFSRDKFGYKHLTALSKLYGNIYRLYCGSKIILILNGFDAIHEAFVKQAAVFTDRPHLFVPLIGVSRGTGIVYNGGHNWRLLRRLTLQSLRDFGVGKKSLEEKIFEEIDVVSGFLTRRDGKPTRVKPLFLSAATNIICNVMFGERFCHDSDKFVELTGVLEEIFRLNAPFAKENFFPITRLFPAGRKLIHRRRTAIEKIKQYLTNTIKEHEESFDVTNIRDFIDLYHKASMDQSNPEVFTEENIYKVTIDLFLGGGETTATTLDWAFLYMIRFPDIQHRCQAEIDKVVGVNRRITMADKASLPFVEATLLEIQRMANTVTFSLPHVAKEDTNLQNYFIPKDTIVVANLYSANIDEKYWKDPLMFYPERFIDADGNVKKKEAFVPFSLGPRYCIGEPLARMELFLFFANLLQKFIFSTVAKDATPSIEGVQVLTLAPRTYDLIAELR